MKPLILFLLAAITLSSCSNYGKKVKSSNIEVYYKDGISKEQAQKTADYIYKLDTNPETKDNKKSFQLTIDGDTVICKMVVNEEKYKDIPIESFETIGGLISMNAFDGKPVNMILSTNRFKPIKTVYFKKMDGADLEGGYGEKITAGNIEVYVKTASSMVDGEMLAKFLEREMAPSETISFQLVKGDDYISTVRMVSTLEKMAGLSEEDVMELAAKISLEIFANNPIVFEFTDNQFNTLKTFNYDPKVPDIK